MTSRLKRVCAICEKRMNLAFDPDKELCHDCIPIWRDNIASDHKNGKITFEKAFKLIDKRCRGTGMSEYDILDILFPPLGDNDFQDDEMALKLNFNMDRIKEIEARHEDE